MTLETARQCLDVAVGATADQLRRAYMRAVRRHRPERDPEGFRRVRQAYELLEAQLDFAFDELGDGWEGTAAAEPEAAPDAPSPLAPFELRLEQAAALEERVAIWRDAVGALPESEEARWGLIHTLVASGEVAAAAREAVAAHRSGLEGFLVHALRLDPAALSDEELDAARRAAPALRWLLVDAWAARGKVVRAAKLAQRALTSPDDGPIAPARVVDLVVRLEGTGRHRTAERLLEALFAWLAEQPPGRLSSPVAAQLALARELVAVGQRINAELTEGLAAAILAGDAKPAQRAARRVLDTHQRVARKALRKHAPNLWRMVEGHFEPDSPREAGGGLGYMGAMVLAIIVALRLTRGCDEPSPATMPEIEPPVVVTPSQRASSGLRTIEIAIQRGDCKRAHELASELSTVVIDPEVERELQRVAGALVTGCADWTLHRRIGLFTIPSRPFGGAGGGDAGAGNLEEDAK